jgi:hypothetical protein
MTAEEAQAEHQAAHRRAEVALVQAFMNAEAADYRKVLDPRTDIVLEWVEKSEGNVTISSISNMGYPMRTLTIKYGEKYDEKTNKYAEPMQIHLCPCGRSYSVIGARGKVLDYTPCYGPKETSDEGERAQPRLLI